MGIFTKLLIAVILAYIVLGVYQLYLLMNPLVGYEQSPNEPIIDPLWRHSESFSIIAFLSNHSKWKPFRLSDLLNGNSQDSLILHQNQLKYNESQVELKFDLKITNDVKNANENNIAISNSMWNDIQSNSTRRSIYFTCIDKKVTYR